GLENIAADIVEINIDAIRGRGPERLERRAVLVIDGGIEAEFGRQPLAFVRAAGDADHAASLDFRDLANDRPDRTGGGRDHDRLAFPRLANVKQPEISGEAGEAVHAQQMRHRFDLRHFGQLPGGYNRVILPAGIAEHEVAGYETL